MDILALLAALGLVALNGFFVATEFAIVKVRPTRLEELIREGRPGASAVRILVRNLDGYLSATQLGITLASLGLGWLGEPAFERIISGPLSRFGLDDPIGAGWAGNAWDPTTIPWLHYTSLTLTFATISFLHIVVGELAPKSVAILRSDATAITVAWPMRVFYVIFLPLTWILNGISNQILRLAGLQPAGHGGETGHSEEEIKIILAQARSAGLLSSARSDILRRALSLPSKAARHVMVPRNDVVFLDINLSIEDNLIRSRDSTHTRFPLCDRELDDVLGIIDVRDVLFRLQHEADPPKDDAAFLRSLAAEVAYFPETMPSERLLSEFRDRRIRMAVIVDEYGGASGIVTPADIVTMVMGELEEEEASNEVVALPGGAYDVEGSATIEEVEETLQTTLPTEDMRTVAGLVIERLGRMPRPGDRIRESGFLFHVLEVEGPRVRRVRIQRDVVAGASRRSPTKDRPSPPRIAEDGRER